MAEVKTKKVTTVKEPKAPKVAKVTVKEEVKEAAPKAEVAEKKVVVTPVAKVNSSLTVDLFDTTGVTTGKIELPAAIFGAKVNKELVAQAIRVYLVNQRQGNASTKTRGEVDGSTRKIYRQKGTGRARHGGIRAPLFVKGGIAHGPKPKDYTLNLSKKMRKAAFVSSLTTKAQNNGVKIVAGFENVASKTKTMATVFEKLGFPLKGRNVLLVLPKDMEAVFKGARNLKGIEVTTAGRLNTYEVLSYKNLVVMQDALKVMEEAFLKQK